MTRLIDEVLSNQVVRLPSPARARLIRKDAGVTQERLAAELGVIRETVARWEMGTRQPRGELRDRYAVLLRELEELTR
jgi:transcriptional regulator with XRE-family HTH domain